MRARLHLFDRGRVHVHEQRRAQPDDTVVQNIFEVLNTGDDKCAAFIRTLLNLIKSTTSALEFISMMGTEVDSDESEDGG